MDRQVTAFFDDRVIAQGQAEQVTRTIEQGWPSDQGAIHVFDDSDGRAIDLDLWDAARPAAEPRAQGRGRPKLGVVAREVTLLPRHWQWLSAQPGGASAAIRRLVEDARKAEPARGGGRDAVYRFVTAMAGNRPGYEEAIRALYRGDLEGFRAQVAEWPKDVRDYAKKLLGGGAA